MTDDEIRELCSDVRRHYISEMPYSFQEDLAALLTLVPELLARALAAEKRYALAVATAEEFKEQLAAMTAERDRLLDAAHGEHYITSGDVHCIGYRQDWSAETCPVCNATP